MRAKADLLVAATSIASRLWSYYDEGPEGLFREPPVSSDGFLWWQTPVALQALLRYEDLTGNKTRHSSILECFRVNNDVDHRIFSPSWGGIENDEKNDDMLWWTLAALTVENDTDLLESGRRSHDHVRRFWAKGDHMNCAGGGIRWSADPSHGGFFYLNAVTNGQFMLASALLEDRVPDGQYYHQWAGKVYHWMRHAALITTDGSVYDGIHAPHCDEHEPRSSPQWSYNLALPLYATAILSKSPLTGGDSIDWLVEHERLKRSFFRHFVDPFGRLHEPACRTSTCGNDARVFLAILARSLGSAYVAMPDARIRQALLSSASDILERHSLDGMRILVLPENEDEGDDSRQIILAHRHRHREDGDIQRHIVALEIVNAAIMVW